MNITLEKRRSGETTGSMLEAIGKAVKNPGTEVYFKDHAIKFNDGYRYLRETALEILNKLKLNVSVISTGSSLVFKSNLKPIYHGSDGHLYQRLQ